LTAAQPFTSALVMSNVKWFRHSLVFEKSHSTGHLNANRAPMRKHEDILVFSHKKYTYNPQKTAKPLKDIRPTSRRTNTESYGAFDANATRTEKENISFPASIIKFNVSPTGGDKGLHPTQKPIALMEYLIKTYSKVGDTILDNAMGSGTTGIACINTERNFIGMENNEKYFEICKTRMANPSHKK
jgi:site-specific DNA-methyltransferase (adenine-specific)